ncbi:hypothetical protein [Bacillus sp. FSL K6-3431]|uniref:hypothetical protein n=1 Tax=Bacillus sp. FSL K6-3431 TaxID=2921500 RepID=UPI0030F4F094
MDQHTFSSEAAKQVGIGVSTLRNYAAVLESKGYQFERGTNNGRIFHKMDLRLITALIEKVTKESMKIDCAATAVLSEAKWKREDSIPLEQEKEKEKDIQREKDIQLEKLYEQIKQLEEQQMKFSDINDKLTLRVERLTEKIEERERDQELLQRLENTRNKKKRKGIALFRPLTAIAGKK